MENGGDRETDSVDLQSGNKAVADQKKDHSVTCSPAFFSLSPTAPVKQISATLYAFCRWRETATLKFYPVDNASESAPFNSKNSQPIVVDRGPISAQFRYAVQSFLFLNTLPLPSLSLS